MSFKHSSEIKKQSNVTIENATSFTSKKVITPLQNDFITPGGRERDK